MHTADAGAIDAALNYIHSQKTRIDEAAATQRQVWEGGQPDVQPLLLTNGAPFPLRAGGAYIIVPAYDPKAVHYNSEKMFASELSGALRAVAGGMQAVPSVRANMGCGIYAAFFGITQDLFEDKMPWVQQHLCKDAINRMGPDDLSFTDEFKTGLEHMDYMAENLKGTGCGIYPLDLQGPFDLAHLVYGDAIFYDLYDDPEFVRHLLELSCEAIFKCMDECLKHIPDADTEIRHYNNLAMPRGKGGIKISEDTSTLLSGEHIREFAAPYTERVLERYGGGYIHYCGKNENLYRAVMDMPLAYGINFGNPDMHDMPGVLRECARNGKIYYGAIPEPEGENTTEYFRKCVSSAYLNGKIHLLLMYTYSPRDGGTASCGTGGGSVVGGVGGGMDGGSVVGGVGGVGGVSECDGIERIKEAWAAACRYVCEK